MAGGDDKEVQQKPAGVSYWQLIRSGASYSAGAVVTSAKFSYTSTLWAAGALSGAAGASVSMVASWVPDAESRSALGRAIVGASRSAAPVAVDEVVRLIPGGRAVCRVAKAGSSEFAKIYNGEEGVKKMEDVNTRLLELERELKELSMRNRMLIEAVEKSAKEKGRGETVVEHLKPNDVIDAFLNRGFKGMDFPHLFLFPKLEVPAEDK